MIRQTPLTSETSTEHAAVIPATVLTNQPQKSRTKNGEGRSQELANLILKFEKTGRLCGAELAELGIIISH